MISRAATGLNLVSGAPLIKLYELVNFNYKSSNIIVDLSIYSDLR